MEKKKYLVYLKGIRGNFSETAWIRYRIPEIKGRKYLLIVFGKCNFKCKYCFVGGGRSSQGIIPEARLIPLEKIENEVLSAVKSNTPVRISGGEPTLFKKETIYLLKIVKNNRGFSIIDSNGSKPDIIKVFSKYCNVLSIDGPKDLYEIIPYTTGVNLEECWDNPLKTMKIAQYFKCIVEFKTVLFEHTGLEHLRFIYNNLPSNSYWTLKQYQPEIGHFSEDPNQEISREINPNFKPMQKNEIFNMVYKLVKEDFNLRNRLTVIIGSARYAENLYQFSSNGKLVTCQQHLELRQSS